MASLKTKKITSALLRKGFRQDNTHHKYYWFYDQGKKTLVKTRVSHGLAEYGDALLSQVRRQLGLETKKQLLDLVECPLSREDYRDILIRKRFLIKE